MLVFVVGKTDRLPETCSFEKRIRREVLPYTPNARYRPGSIEFGCEISFTRYFCKPQPTCTLSEIRADILSLQNETEGLLEEIFDGCRRDAGMKRSL